METTSIKWMISQSIYTTHDIIYFVMGIAIPKGQVEHYEALRGKIWIHMRVWVVSVCVMESNNTFMTIFDMLIKVFTISLYGSIPARFLFQQRYQVHNVIEGLSNYSHSSKYCLASNKFSVKISALYMCSNKFKFLLFLCNYRC